VKQWRWLTGIIGEITILCALLAQCKVTACI